MKNKERVLKLVKLKHGLPAVTPAFGAALAEAAAVCFEDQNHSGGVRLEVDGTFKAEYSVYWEKVTKQMRSCWNDLEVTTEQAAYGVAFLLITDLTDYTIIHRSRKGTGFDYWLGKEGDKDELPFQNTARLEVSGIRKGNQSLIKTRVKDKLNQVCRSDDLRLPAYIVIVEFSNPLSKVIKK
ncbi:MAG: hypothetical protein BWK80_10175 [Desulfobacteraceae bacterium IS3]|nr:MAG: hypothetical protein BWK80_10175 [Desulfobacteraceae bacterium IS3]